MSEPLNYAAASTENRRSRMASYALGISILQIPAFLLTYLIGRALGPSRGDPATAVLILTMLATLLISPLAGFSLGISAAIRSWHSRGALHGAGKGLLAATISAAWPVGLVAYALPRINLC
jgi:hypothetical protein